VSDESFLQIASLGDRASLLLSKSRRELVERGLRDAAFLASVPLSDNSGVSGQETRKETWRFRHSFEETLRSAEQGDAEAQFDLGRAYDGGDVFSHIQQDSAEAATWYLKAAEQGHVSAQWNLSCLYAYGEGVRQDYTEALLWAHKAAEYGHDAYAQRAVGSAYEHGQGVTQDYTEAVNWYRKAAEQRNALAQFNLGTMYRFGLGVPRDLVNAHMWIDLAARACTGDNHTDDDQKEYSSALEAVAAEMTPQEIADAEALARDWNLTFRKQRS
jgi:uncharacterized protein